MVGRLWELCAGVRCAPEQSAAYRRLWDGRSTHQRWCMYLGPDTGRREPCGRCRGRVQLKVFACDHPTHAASPTTTLGECSRCSDFAPQLLREENA
jgi:hypothetical protein